MAVRLPEGARKILSDETNFFKRDKPVVDRLRTSTDGHYISALQKIDNIIQAYEPINIHTVEPIFKDPYLGQWGVFLEYLVFCSVNYSQKSADEIRNARKDFAEKMDNISNKAAELSELIRKADNLGEKYGLSVNVDTRPLSLLQSAIDNQADAETKHRYYDTCNPCGESVASTLEQMGYKFSYKCFPPITALLDEISRQYDHDLESTEYAKVAKSTSKINDFCQQFFEDMEHSIDVFQFSPRLLSRGIVTYTHWAELFSVALGFPISVTDIKNYPRAKKHESVNSA